MSEEQKFEWPNPWAVDVDKDKIKDLQRENARLRKALEEIVVLEYDHESMTDIARIALKPQGPVL